MITPIENLILAELNKDYFRINVIFGLPRPYIQQQYVTMLLA